MRNRNTRIMRKSAAGPLIGIFLLISITLAFSTCEYEEEQPVKMNKEYRLKAISSNGIIDVDSEVYTYNEDGLLTQVIKNGDSQDNTVVETYQYDKKDRVTVITQISPNGDTSITSIEYDSKGNKSKTETKDLFGVIDNITYYFYDDNDMLVKKEVRAPSNAVIGTADFVYEQEEVNGYGKERSEMLILGQ